MTDQLSRREERRGTRRLMMCVAVVSLALLMASLVWLVLQPSIG
jgi:hypothetical protein